MKRKTYSLVIIALIMLCNPVFSQQKGNLNKIGFSMPLIWNNSNGVYYSLGSRREPSGNATSYGANINYSRFFLKNVFIVGGIGYWNQKFDIQRPFEYMAPNGTEPLVSTKNYSYQNIHLLIGTGYQKRVSDRWSVAGQLTYNIYNSYRQKYAQEYFPGQNEDYTNYFKIGNTINVDFRCEHYLNNRLSIGAAIVLPMYVHWNKDKVFIKYGYSDDSQIIAHTKKSFGANLSVYYHLKNKPL